MRSRARRVSMRACSDARGASHRRQWFQARLAIRRRSRRSQAPGQNETGLHYNWHRNYDPTLGRYTQPDPLGFVDGPSMYGYAGESPLRYVDRDGLDSIPQSRPPASSNVCLKDDCQKCLTACDKGSAAISKFCASTIMPPQIKVLCYGVVYSGRVACRGHCFNNHCADVPL
jgi:RHS repeat-associated protein